MNSAAVVTVLMMAGFCRLKNGTGEYSDSGDDNGSDGDRLRIHCIVQ